MTGRLLIISLFLVSFFNLPRTAIDKLFLDININDTNLYDNLSKNKHLILLTDKSTFTQDNIIEAKFKGKSKLYAFADSIHLKIWTTLSFSSPDKQGKYSDIKDGLQIKLFIYHNKKSIIDSNYIILKEKIVEAIKSNKPNWTNQEGARDGVYFLTDKLHPILSIYKDVRQSPHLVIEMDNIN